MQPPQPPPGGGWDSGGGWQQAPPAPGGSGQAWTPPPQAPAGPQGWQTQPGGYGTPPPGLPGGPPVAKQGRGPAIWIALGAVVVAAAVGAYFAFFASGSDSSGPEGVVRTYYNAAVDGDCDTMVDHIDLDAAGAPRATVLEQCQQLYEDGALEEADVPTRLDEIKVVSETGSTAKVSVTYETAEGSDSEEVNLNKVDGDWKIDLGSLNPEDTTTTTGADDSTTTTAEETTTTAAETTTTTGTPSTTVAAEGALTPPPLDGPEGQNAANAQLATDCGGGNMTACDQLYWDSDYGGELETYAKSCGGLVPSADASNQCVSRFGEQVAAG